MIKRQSNESDYEYKNRILYLINYTLPDLEDDLSSNENYQIYFKDYEEEERYILNRRLALSIKDIYQIGVDVIKNSSCLLAEKKLNELFDLLKDQIISIKEKQDLEDKMLELLKKRMELVEDAINNIVDYEDFRSLNISNEISPANYKNIVEANNKNKISIDELIKKIDKIKELSDLIKLSRNVIKN